MENIELGFLELLLECEVLKFGNFKTKSGRNSPYFFNTGALNSAMKIKKASDFYASLIDKKLNDGVDNLFGPAYKGIPLAVSIALSLAELKGKDISYTFNRKEKKDHGEGGELVGHKYLGGEGVVIVEDVITGGTSLRDTYTLLKNISQDTLKQVKAIVVGVDRQEVGTKDISARQEIEQMYGIPVYSILNIDKIVELLFDKKVCGRVWIDQPILVKIKEYQKLYGAPRG